MISGNFYLFVQIAPYDKVDGVELDSVVINGISFRYDLPYFDRIDGVAGGGDIGNNE